MTNQRLFREANSIIVRRLASHGYNRPMTAGIVYLIGAGPGDPKLITVGGADALRIADVVVYDRLAHPKLLDYAPPAAARSARSALISSCFIACLSACLPTYTRSASGGA